MSRLKEALSFKTDEERLAWFHSLASDEQAEILDEIRVTSAQIAAAFQPMLDVVRAWWSMAEAVFADAAAFIELADEYE